MDELIQDAVCERLKPWLCTRGTCVVREGDPVNEMLFIIRGHLDSYTTNGGRTGFFNSCRLGPGDFCGEELLTWALELHPRFILPSSTRTVQAVSEVETFALTAEDVRFVASQFRRLNSKKLRHTLRFHSHQWRTWAACFIQAAWFRYKRRKEAAELKARENLANNVVEQIGNTSTGLGSTLSTCVGKFMASTKRSGGERLGPDFDILGSLQKPIEPEFSVEDS